MAMLHALEPARALVQRSLGYAFRDPRLLRQALTHSSVLGLLLTTTPAVAAAAAPGSVLGRLDAAGFFAGADAGAGAAISAPPTALEASNERLELLGDAMLGAAVAAELFAHEPPLAEGDMTTARALLVCEAALARHARAIGLGAQLFVGDDALRDGDGVLADALEALIGAVFFEGGFDAARSACLPLIDVRTVLAGRSAAGWAAASGGGGGGGGAGPGPGVDRGAKNVLQELAMDAQRGRLPVLPVYAIERERGPSNAREFAASCTVAALGVRVEAESFFQSKKGAEADAARRALVALGRR